MGPSSRVVWRAVLSLAILVSRRGAAVVCARARRIAHDAVTGYHSARAHPFVGRGLLVQAGTDQPRQSLLETQQLRSSFVQTRPIILNVVHERRKPDRVLPRE